MLPPGDHQRANRIFNRILRRLEERDKSNGKITEDTHECNGTRPATTGSVDSTNGRTTPAERIRSALSESLNT